jgi:hypothetical protein
MFGISPQNFDLNAWIPCQHLRKFPACESSKYTLYHNFPLFTMVKTMNQPNRVQRANEYKHISTRLKVTIRFSLDEIGVPVRVAAKVWRSLSNEPILSRCIKRQGLRLAMFASGKEERFSTCLPFCAIGGKLLSTFTC